MKCFIYSRQIDEYSTNVANHSPQPCWDTPSQSRLPDSSHELIKPFVIQFSIILDSLTIGAAVLPSLRAQYQVYLVIFYLIFIVLSLLNLHINTL